MTISPGAGVQACAGGQRQPLNTQPTVGADTGRILMGPNDEGAGSKTGYETTLKGQELALPRPVDTVLACC